MAEVVRNSIFYGGSVIQHVLGRWIQFVNSEKKVEYTPFMENKMGQGLLKKLVWLEK